MNTTTTAGRRTGGNIEASAQINVAINTIKYGVTSRNFWLDL